MKKFIKAAGIITGIAGACAVAVGVGYIISQKLFCVELLNPRSAASIGIIGGADGPTSIFIAQANKPLDFTILSIIISAAFKALALLATLLIRIRVKFQAKNKKQ